MDGKILIAYFSRKGMNYVSGSIVNLDVGNTEVAAGMVADITGGKLLKIDPFEEYPNDYTECTDVAKVEKRNNTRPKIKEMPENLSEYDTVVLAYPNWWGTVPMPVMTFLDSADLEEKRILPLCTNEGSGMGSSESDIGKACPDSIVCKGLAIKGGSVASSKGRIEKWLGEVL